MIWRFLDPLLLIDLMKGMWLTLKYAAAGLHLPMPRPSGGRRRRASAACCGSRPSPPPGRRPASSATSAPKACPDDLIALGGHREPGQKIKILDYFDFNLSRCSFCGLCAEVCPTKPIKALIMSEDYELGSYSRDTQILRVDEMYDGVPIEQYCGETFFASRKPPDRFIVAVAIGYLSARFL